MNRFGTCLLSLLATTTLVVPALGQDSQELNLYSSRHYDTDERLYDNFTEQTGITINRIEAGADELIERLKVEGDNSPGDVLISVDAGRLWRAAEEGLLQPIESEVLDERIPENLRHPDGLWFGFSQRARVIYYNKENIDPSLIGSYQDLAKPELEGEVCIRPSSNIYNLSLMAAMIERVGYDEAVKWAKGVVNNFARPPEGNDTAQIEGVASGECGVAVANTYYFARMLEEDPSIADKVGVIFPDQDGEGTHVNISGAGVLANAPHPEAAVQFLEYLASDEAQRYFAEGNHEYPVVDTVEYTAPLQEMGEFEADDLNVAVLGENQPQAQQAYDEAGWN